MNDPTTAVQVLDHLEDLLGVIARTELSGTEDTVAIPSRRWDEYLSLALTEIRQFGASSVQVTRRLRALLEDLREAVPLDRRAPVEAELARLDATVAREWGDLVDLDLARTADRQGIGGAEGRSAFHPG